MTLSKIAKSYPQEALSAYTHGFSSRWTYLSRQFLTLLISSNHYIEKIIQNHFILTLTDWSPFSKSERLLLSLPVRLEGLGITKPDDDSSH